MPESYASPVDVKEALNQQQYIVSDEIATTIFLSQQLGKPLLTEGPAGVGKTELAKSIAKATGRELGTLEAVHRPLVILTSNNTRELSEALKRRCLYLFIGYPSI